MKAPAERHLRHSKASFSRIRKRGQRIKRGERRHLKREFLRRYPQTSTGISDICRQIGIGRCTFYAWLKRDAAFRARYQAIIDAREAAEQAEFERFMVNIERERAVYWRNLTDGALARALSVMSRRRARK